MRLAFQVWRFRISGPFGGIKDVLHPIDRDYDVIL